MIIVRLLVSEMVSNMHIPLSMVLMNIVLFIRNSLLNIPRTLTLARNYTGLSHMNQSMHHQSARLNLFASGNLTRSYNPCRISLIRMISVQLKRLKRMPKSMRMPINPIMRNSKAIANDMAIHHYSILSGSLRAMVSTAHLKSSKPIWDIYRH